MFWHLWGLCKSTDEYVNYYFYFSHAAKDTTDNHSVRKPGPLQTPSRCPFRHRRLGAAPLLLVDTQVLLY